jgi:hypothetical protein
MEQEVTHGWRTSRAAQICGWTGVLVLTGFVLLLLRAALQPNVSVPAALAMVAMVAGASIHVYRLSVHPRIWATVHGLLVRNPYSTIEVPWAEIKKLSPGYSGLCIQRSDGSEVTAWAVQKSNIANAAGHRTRADAVAEDIARRAAQAQGNNPAQLGPTVEEQTARAHSTALFMVVAIGVLILVVAIVSR